MISQAAVICLTRGVSSGDILGAAGLLAWLEREVPGFSGRLLGQGRCRDRELEATLYHLAPPLLLIWQGLPQTGSQQSCLARLRAGLPETAFVLVGPCVPDLSSARICLERLPLLNAVLCGEAERGLLELLQLPHHAELLRGALDGLDAASLSPGLCLRHAAGILVGPAPASQLAVEALPSPLLSGKLEVRPYARRVVLEVLRGAIPHSPIPLHMQSAVPRALPLERLSAELECILPLSPLTLQLEGGPLDLAPAHLRAVLERIAALNQGTGIHLELSQVPAVELAELLRAAGVSRIHLRHPSKEGRELVSDGPMDRQALLNVLRMGTEVHVELPLGRATDATTDIQTLLDAYSLVPGVVLKLEPVHLWPGHRLLEPIERPDRAPAPISLGYARSGAYEVVHTHLSTAGELAGMQPTRLALSRLGTLFPNTLRLLARALQQPFSQVLDALGRWLGLHRVPRLPAAVSAEILRGRLARYMTRALQQVTRMDLVPVLRQAARFEQWLNEHYYPPAIEESMDVDLTDLGSYVLDLAPGVEFLSFPYDVPALMQHLNPEEVPVRRTYVVLKRRSSGTPTVLTVSVRVARMLDLLDGATPVAVLRDHLAELHRENDAVSNATREDFEVLLERGLAMAVGHFRDAHLEEGAGQSNILLFRRPSSDQTTGEPADD